MTPATAIALGWGRAPEPGERCACGRDAVIVYPGHEGGTPHCGVNEGADDTAEDVRE